MATVERHTVGGVPFIFQKHRSGWSIWYASMGGVAVPSGVGHPPPRGGWPTLDAAMMAAELIAADPHSKRFMTKNGGRMKRTSRRSKRTSRRNGVSGSQVMRAKKIKALESKTTHALHRLRVDWQHGPNLTIPEERALDSIAIDIARTRAVVNGMDQDVLVGRVRKALGYTY